MEQYILVKPSLEIDLESLQKVATEKIFGSLFTD